MATPLGADAGYYLATGSRILEGWRPFTDLHLIYTPLAVYSYLPILALQGQFNALQTCFLLQSTLILLGAIPLYLLLCQVTTNLRLQLALVGNYFTLCFLLEGGQIVLEPMVNIFALLGLLFSLRSSMASAVVSGICVTFAFLSKQYGLQALIPVAVAILANRDLALGERLTRFVSMLIAATLTLAAITSAALVSHNETLQSIIASIFPANYLSSPHPYSCVLDDWIQYFPWILVGPMALSRKQFSAQPIQLAAVFGFAAASLCLIFRQFPHYYMLALPFAMLICGMIAESLAYHRPLAYLSFMLLVGLVPARGLVRAHQNSLSNGRLLQELRLQGLRDLLPPHQAGVVLGHQSLLFLGNIDPPRAQSKIGYSFFYDDAALKELLPDQDVVLLEKLDERRLAFRFDNTESVQQVTKLLRHSGFKRTGEACLVEVWTKYPASCTQTSFNRHSCNAASRDTEKDIGRCWAF